MAVRDWAAFAADALVAEFGGRVRRERIAAVLAVHLEPLEALLRESIRQHHHEEDDNFYCCGKCACGCTFQHEEDYEHGSECYPADYPQRPTGVCNCGADAWNERVRAALAGRDK